MRRQETRQYKGDIVRKTSFVVALASAAVMMIAGTASADTLRTVTRTYQGPGIGQGDTGGFCLGPDSGTGLDSCMEADPEALETTVDVTVTDSAGSPVYFSIGQDLDGDGATDTFGNGCGTITGFPIDPVGVGGQPNTVIVFPWAGPGVNPDFSTVPPTVNPCSPGSSALGGTGVFTFHSP
jgi:hypothetical protein